MLVVRAEQLRQLSEARRNELVDEVLVRAADVIGSPVAGFSTADSRDTWRRLVAQAFDQADRFLFLDPEVRLRFAEHCVRRGALFEEPLQSHLIAADVEHPDQDDSKRFELLVDLQRRGCGTEPRRRPARDPASQPLSLDEFQG